VCRQSNFSWW